MARRSLPARRGRRSRPPPGPPPPAFVAGVATEQRRGPRRARRRGGHLDERPDELLRAGDLVLKLDHNARLLHAGVVGELLGQVHLRGGHAEAVEFGDPFVRGARAQRLRDLAVRALDRRPIRRVEDVECQVLGRVVLNAEQGADLASVPVAERADDDRAVANGVAAVVEAQLRAQQVVHAAALGHHLAVVAAAFPHRLDALHHRVARHGVEDWRARDFATHHHHPGREQRAADMLALAAALAMDEGSADAHREDDACRVVDDTRALHEFGSSELVALDLGGHQPAVGLRDDVRAGAAGVAAVAAEAGVLGVDQVRAVLAQRLVVHAEAARRAVAEVRDDDIERRNELLHQAPCVVVLEVDGETALATVERVKRLGLARDRTAPPPRRSAVERLHLHHVRSEVGERDAAEGSGDDLRELEHAYSFEWSGHGRLLPAPPRGGAPIGPDGSSHVSPPDRTRRGPREQQAATRRCPGAGASPPRRSARRPRSSPRPASWRRPAPRRGCGSRRGRRGRDRRAAPGWASRRAES